MSGILPATSWRAGGESVSGGLTTVLFAVVAVAALYFGRDVLVPVALAMLLSFVLARGDAPRTTIAEVMGEHSLARRAKTRPRCPVAGRWSGGRSARQRRRPPQRHRHMLHRRCVPIREN